MAGKEAYVPLEKKADWTPAVLFWGGLGVAVVSGSTAVAIAGVALMGIGAYSWFKNKGK